ncbi:MAG: YceI family protein [Crocinitomicaceae bacterium]|nr:YceI family protein [Crocinitomicaceae bacterium]
MKKIIYSFGLLAFTLASCGGGEAESTTTTDTVEVCKYSYDSSATELTWTAFKLTEKIGVNGTFNQINVTAKDSVADMFAVLTGATFEIPIASLNSQDPVRDGKVTRSFFGNMIETSSITGTVNSISATTASVAILMNGVTKEYTGTVTVDAETITMTTTIDLIDFNAQTSMDSLSVVCSEKHTGPDGVNKFWSTVDIAVKTTLVKTCK